MNVARISLAALLLASQAGLAPASDGRNITNINGSVRASPGEVYDTLSTVNGDVRVARGASADVAKSVNGEIIIEQDVKVGRVSTVNGSVRIDDGAAVAHEASTVNGSVRLGKRARVGGDVSSVSGEIELEGAEVTGKLQTYNGDIDLSGGARVLGGIHVKKSKGDNSDWSWQHKNPPEVHICSTCVVEGELRFDRPVELRVDPGAKIGQVIGEQVERR
jgi:DUF4097 and DUF4098 domain-containing protein YvlB